MANFTTHLAVGTLVSGALATVTLAADVVAPENLIAVTMAGMLGSVLPDKAGRTPAALQKLVESEVARWTPVLKAAGVTAN